MLCDIFLDVPRSNPLLRGPVVCKTPDIFHSSSRHPKIFYGLTSILTSRPSRVLLFIEDISSSKSELRKIGTPIAFPFPHVLHFASYPIPLRQTTRSSYDSYSWPIASVRQKAVRSCHETENGFCPVHSIDTRKKLQVKPC